MFSLIVDVNFHFIHTQICVGQGTVPLEIAMFSLMSKFILYTHKYMWVREPCPYKLQCSALCQSSFCAHKNICGSGNCALVNCTVQPYSGCQSSFYAHTNIYGSGNCALVNDKMCNLILYANYSQVPTSFLSCMSWIVCKTWGVLVGTAQYTITKLQNLGKIDLYLAHNIIMAVT